MDNHPLLSLVVARSKIGVIGCDNRLPWNVPSDLKRFKEITMGHPIVMCRNTFQSIGRPLPGRKNIVVSRDPVLLNSRRFEGVELFGDLDSALLRAEVVCNETGVSEIMVVGGGEVFNSLLTRADKIYLTEIDVIIDDPNAIYFSADFSGWRQTKRLTYRGPNDEFSYSYAEYERYRSSASASAGYSAIMAAE